jgi:hypothetical protein
MTPWKRWPMSRLVIKLGVGGPSGCEKAAKRCTELNRTVGPTLKKLAVFN